MKGYVWFSAGSDTTGPALAKALDFGGGKKTPSLDGMEVIVGFGCKAGEKYVAANFNHAVAQGKLRILNRVEAVECNRDKFGTLQKLAAAKVPTPGMVGGTGGILAGLITAAIKAGTLDMPLVINDIRHSEEPVFCSTLEEVAQACKSLVQGGNYYARSLCAGTEYRIHILRDTAILAQVKAPAKNPTAALVGQLQEELQQKAAKAKIKLDGPTASLILGAIAPELLRGPTQLLRSVNRGWQLTPCDVSKVPKFAIAAAMQALDAAGLDLGAVSLIADEKSARVTSITTGPSLDEAQLGVYVAAIKEFCGPAKEAPKAKELLVKVEDGEEEAPEELIAKLVRKLRGGLTKKEVEKLISALDK